MLSFQQCPVDILTVSILIVVILIVAFRIVEIRIEEILRVDILADILIAVITREGSLIAVIFIIAEIFTVDSPIVVYLILDNKTQNSDILKRTLNMSVSSLTFNDPHFSSRQ